MEMSFGAWCGIIELAYSTGIVSCNDTVTNIFPHSLWLILFGRFGCEKTGSCCGGSLQKIHPRAYGKTVANA